MNSSVIGDNRPDTEALEAMRKSPYTFESTRWAAYQNHDLGHYNVGHLRFLAVGPDNTVKEAHSRLPDFPGEINWRYIFVGWVNLETGEIEEVENERQTQN